MLVWSFVSNILEQLYHSHDLRYAAALQLLHLCHQSSSRIDLQTLSLGPFLHEAGPLSKRFLRATTCCAVCVRFLRAIVVQVLNRVGTGACAEFRSGWIQTRRISSRHRGWYTQGPMPPKPMPRALGNARARLASGAVRIAAV